MLARELTLDVLYTLAADAASAQAGLQLVQKSKLNQLRISSDETRLTGACVGSDRRDVYQVSVDLAEANPGSAHYVACTCPSMKVPCKHALALMAAYVQQPGAFVIEDMPCGSKPIGDHFGASVRRRLPVAPDTVPQPTFDPVTASFLQTIRDTPEDDSPRLVYADWLEEHGDLPRAEFIRAQCELGRHASDGSADVALAERAEQLLKKHRKEWVAPLPLWMKRMRPVFRRGFVDEVTESAHLLLKYVAALFAAAPIRAVRLLLVGTQGRSAAAHASALAGSSYLSQVACLDLSPSPGAAASQIKVLLHTPFLKGLETLILNGLPLAHHHLGAVTTPFLAGLKRLELRNTGLGPAAVRVLAAWPGLRQLSWLDLCDNRLDTAAARHLAASPHLGDALVLAVSPNIGSAGQAALRDRLGGRLRVVDVGQPDQ